MKERPAPEIIMLVFGVGAITALLTYVLFVAIFAMLHPDHDFGGFLDVINTQLSLIIGAVLGFAARAGLARVKAEGEFTGLGSGDSGESATEAKEST